MMLLIVTTNATIICIHLPPPISRQFEMGTTTIKRSQNIVLTIKMSEVAMQGLNKQMAPSPSL